MSLINFTNLDFDQIKQSLKDYIQSNSDFTDYDFEGSNLSTILDVLAYNTYITSYNANMISNEVFIDSATLRENVVALARNIGYVPRSKKSSRADVSFFADLSDISPTPANITLKAGPVASTGGQFNGQSFVFGIPEDITVSVVDGIASFDEIEVFEGTFLSQTYVYSTRNPFQKFILPNIGIDLDSLVVSVRPSVDSSVSAKYTRQDELFDTTTKSTITGNSNIYFIQEVEGEQYEVIFGDGVFGKSLEDGNVIEMTYITTNGADGNGISNFTFSGSLSYVRNSVEIFITKKAISNVNSTPRSPFNSLTRNIAHYTISVNPQKVVDKDASASLLSSLTKKTKQFYLKKLNSNKKFEFLERNIRFNQSEVKLIQKFEGLDIKKVYRRSYPHGPVVSQILGYNDTDGNGNPVGLNTSWTTAGASSGTFTVQLQHQPDVKTATSGANDGDTDFALTFNLNIN